MRIKIEVKAVDIKKGKDTMVKPGLCPIARALQRALKRPNQRTGYVGFWLGKYRVEFPQSARTFQDRGFNDLPLKPFSFTIRIPEDALSV